MNHIYHTTDIMEALHFNYPVVFECYTDTNIKCFVYHPTCTNWEQTVEYHTKRHRSPVYSFIDLREVNAEVNFLDDKFFMHVPNKLLSLKVDPKKILYIGNHHAQVDEQDIQRITRLPLPCLQLRYFEADAVLRHQVNEHNHRNWQGPLVKKSLSVSHDYLALFGKPRKFMRSGAILKMHQMGMSKNSIVSCLAEAQGMDQTIQSASEYWPINQLKEILPIYAGAVDNIEYDSPHTDNSNYRGYPYDPALYQKTAVSIIAETNDIPIAGIPTLGEFFITEKTARTLYNQHPFVMLSTQFFLHKLRKLGYRTFNQIIDESYDLESDPEMRLEMALKAAQQLIKNCDNPIVKEVCRYNYQHLHTVYSIVRYQTINKLLFVASSK